MKLKDNRIILEFFKAKWLFILMLFFLALSFLLESMSEKRFYTSRDTFIFQKKLQAKEVIMDSLLAGISVQGSNVKNKFFLTDYSRKNNLSNNGFSIFVYSNDTLDYWSENNISIPRIRKDFGNDELVVVAGSIYVKREIAIGNSDILGLILVKQQYPYENRFLRNGFQKDFNLAPEVNVFTYKIDNDQNAVYSIDGNFLFTLNYNFTRKLNVVEKQFSIIFYVIVFILFLFFIRRFIHNASGRLKKLLFFSGIILLGLFYYLSNYFRFPEIIFNLELFSPEKYARSVLFPSLGDLLILAVSAFFIIYIFYKEYIIDLTKLRKSFLLTGLLILVFSVLILGWFQLTTFLVQSLIMDSTISFETYKVLNLTIYTFFGFFILGLLFASLSLLIDKILGILKNIRQITLAIYLILLWNFLIFLQVAFNETINLESAIFFFILSFLIYFMRIFRQGIYHFSGFVGFVLLFSAFTVFEVVKYSNKKSQTDMKIKAVNLSAEHDPVAELLFIDIDRKLKEDQEIKKLLFDRVIDIKLILNTLQRKYFSGFWDKYDLQVTACEPSDSLYVVPPEDRWYHCYEFFNEIVQNDGINVSKTDFYFLDNLNGRISYFASIPYFSEDKETTLFIELNSRLISEGLGYPELLLDDKYNPPPSAGEYSYAKYNGGKMITFSGSFAYYMNSNIYTDGSEGWSFVKKDNYDHLVYNIDKYNTIIVSKPTVFWVDILISFSYIFSFFFIIMVFFLLITNISPLTTTLQWNFKNKIQFAMTGLLSFSLLCIGAGIVFFSIRQYQSKHVEILQEKIQSVYVELIHKLESERDLHEWASENYYNLDDLLEKLSNIFYTDINMYDSRGELIGTSRPEIIQNNLIAGRMNSQAYLEMVVNRRSEYIHKENIGELQYLSAYVPFVNSENHLLAYLNLPYFTRQDELTSEITNLVIAIVNIMVLMSLLSFTIAVFLSNKIAHPLRMLKESFSKVSLTNSEKVQYKGKDEIGSLVNEYNKMVDELTRSAELLAKSERESAWREMAKQIAHEIKNPLTPMRLSIQHLQRSIHDNKDNWDEQFDRLSKMLIEQIDSLSAIATEFSNFAKMPAANNEKLDLIKKLSDACNLFENTENVKIELNLPEKSGIYIYADREQINRVFINLIKNATQAIQDNPDGLLIVSLEINENTAIVRFRDNGKGVPVEIREKLFQPNFTTKSGGMGMGLAIVESILKNAGGRVYYESELNKGSVFIVELPIYYD